MAAHTSLARLLRGMRDALIEADAGLRRRGGAQPRVAELSFSFDCRLGYRWSRPAGRHQLVMQFGRGRFWWLHRRPLHHVRIVCIADQEWEPRISIDGKTVALSCAREAAA